MDIVWWLTQCTALKHGLLYQYTAAIMHDTVINWQLLGKTVFSQVILLILDECGCGHLWTCRWDHRISVIFVWKSNVGGEISLKSQGDLDASSQSESRLYTDVLISPPSSPSPVSHLSFGFHWRSLMLPDPSYFSLIYSEWLLNGTLFRFADIVSNHQFCMSSLSHLSASHTATGPFTAPAVVCMGNGDMQSPFQSVYLCIVCVCARLIVCVQQFKPTFSLEIFSYCQVRQALYTAKLKIRQGFSKLDL